MSFPVAVEAKFETDGSIRPLAFVWEDEIIRIVSMGRQWEQDGEMHFLVMSMDEKVYELAYQPSEGRWMFYPRPQDLGGKRLHV
jgi:hypothetical protein